MSHKSGSIKGFFLNKKHDTHLNELFEEGERSGVNQDFSSRDFIGTLRPSLWVANV